MCCGKAVQAKRRRRAAFGLKNSRVGLIIPIKMSYPIKLGKYAQNGGKYEIPI